MRFLQQEFFRQPLLAFLLSRCFTAFFVYLGHGQHPYLAPVVGGYEGVPNWWLNPWTTFDSVHFLNIAREGYATRNAAFFPFYPWLLKVAGNSPVAMACWGVFLSNLAFLAALVLFHRLTARECSLPLARRAVWLLAFFPTTAYFSAVYTDAVFLFFFVAAFWFWRHERWMAAALCGLLAALTRNLGPLLFLAFAVEWWQGRRRVLGPQRPQAFALIAVLAPLAGFFIAQSLVVWQVGSAFSSVSSQAEYFRAPTWPWLPIWKDLLLLGKGYGVVLWLHLGATLLALLLLWRHRCTLRASYAVMLSGLLLMHLTLGHTIIPYTLPTARYLSTMFPFTQLLAADTELFARSRLRTVLLAAFWLLLLALVSFEFGRKGFVG